MENYAGLIELIFVFAMLGLGWFVLERQGRKLDRARDARDEERKKSGQ